MPPPKVVWPEDQVRRVRELDAHRDGWHREHGWDADPDDDPEFVRRSREIMGLPPLRTPTTT